MNAITETEARAVKAPALEAARQFVPDQGHELLYEVHGVRLSDAVCKALLEQGLSAWG